MKQPLNTKVLPPSLVALLPTLALLGGCSSDDSPEETVGSQSADAGLNDAGNGPSGASSEGPGSCSYDNAFSQSPECRQYPGAEWTSESAEEDCDAVSGVFTSDPCQLDKLGSCLLNGEDANATQLVFPGSDAESCGATQRGCELFAGGVFTPSEVCSGGEQPEPSMPGIGSGGSVFTKSELECRAPLAGEPEGETDGEVCTRSMISACTEPGRKFADYASCETVLTQRPYAPVPPPSEPAAKDDPRLDDEAYMTELAWMKEQVEACACVCCHSDDVAPAGASIWDIDRDPLWIDTFRDIGLAMSIGWIGSESFGAYQPEDNNGFSRDETGLPTSDVERMQAFLGLELERRGAQQADFKDANPFGGPLHAQSIYEPEPCENGNGVDAEGKVTWSGGDARYLYVLEAGSENPGVPPNKDTPDGTLWKLEVPADGTPFATGVTYGDSPAGAAQVIPAQDQKPAALKSGETYYLVALGDIAIPVTRCLFTP